MWPHGRAILSLLVLTLLICCVLYPGVLWLVGQGLFRHQAQGSLVDDQGRPASDEKKAVGSLLVAQPFTADEYFHPRPSAVGYTGQASGASNYGASNPDLRKRVMGSLGPLIKYDDGRPVGPDVVTWFRDRLQKDPAVLAAWAKDDDGLAERWVKADSANADFVKKWQESHPREVEAWKKDHPDAEEIKPADVAGLFFGSYAEGKTTDWPQTDGKDLQALFFETWWKAHADAKFQPVPAELVMTSGSGLDPNITLKAALYQLDRVAEAWAKKGSGGADRIKADVETLLRQKAGAPLVGLAGEEMVNVLEVNLALRATMKERANP